MCTTHRRLIKRTSDAASNAKIYSISSSFTALLYYYYFVNMKYVTAGLLFVPCARSFTNTKVIATLARRQPPVSALHLYQIHDDMDTPKFDGPITSTAEASTSSYMASDLLPPPVSSLHRNFVSNIM
jgi:hypothetical protein